jgi:hypothetical protein
LLTVLIWRRHSALRALRALWCLPRGVERRRGWKETRDEGEEERAQKKKARITTAHLLLREESSTFILQWQREYHLHSPHKGDGIV